jgi:3-deoxy-D-arabino-heptulosonate 7-phosphate (DAHP) synthase class II
MLPGVRDAELESMRRDWSDGERRLAAARVRDPARAVAYDRVVNELRRNLRRRIGQTFSLADLAAVYARSAVWTRDVAQRAAPGAAYAHDLAVTADAVFAEAARQASDWTP